MAIHQAKNRMGQEPRRKEILMSVSWMKAFILTLSHDLALHPIPLPGACLPAGRARGESEGGGELLHPFDRPKSVFKGGVKGAASFDELRTLSTSKRRVNPESLGLSSSRRRSAAFSPGSRRVHWLSINPGQLFLHGK